MRFFIFRCPFSRSSDTLFFFFIATATTGIYTLSLHDALPISDGGLLSLRHEVPRQCRHPDVIAKEGIIPYHCREKTIDRKSTRLNSSHLGISYAVFCLKKKKII